MDMQLFEKGKISSVFKKKSKTFNSALNIRALYERWMEKLDTWLKLFLVRNKSVLIYGHEENLHVRFIFIVLSSVYDMHNMQYVILLPPIFHLDLESM